MVDPVWEQEADPNWKPCCRTMVRCVLVHQWRGHAIDLQLADSGQALGMIAKKPVDQSIIENPAKKDTKAKIRRQHELKWPINHYLIISI
jgi:hypothetical protein